MRHLILYKHQLSWAGHSAAQSCNNSDSISSLVDVIVSVWNTTQIGQIFVPLWTQQWNSFQLKDVWKSQWWWFHAFNHLPISTPAQLRQAWLRISRLSWRKNTSNKWTPKIKHLKKSDWISVIQSSLSWFSGYFLSRLKKKHVAVVRRNHGETIRLCQKRWTMVRCGFIPEKYFAQLEIFPTSRWNSKKSAWNNLVRWLRISDSKDESVNPSQAMNSTTLQRFKHPNPPLFLHVLMQSDFQKKISRRSLLQTWAFQFLHYAFLCLDLLKMRVKKANKNIFSTWGGNLPPKIVQKVDVPKWFQSHSQSFVGFRGVLGVWRSHERGNQFYNLIGLVWKPHL